GVIIVFKNNDGIGRILNYLNSFSSSEVEVLEKKELIAVKFFLKEKDNGTKFTAKITNLIHADGKISIYYEDISMEISESQPMLGIQKYLQCNKSKKLLNECC
ncbi:unnamed protein product, partial [Schistosoma spindalis]